MKSKKIICIISALAAAMAALLIYLNTRPKYDGETEIKVVSPRSIYFWGSFEHNGELYSRTETGIVRYTENGGTSPFIAFESERSDYTICGGKIYLVDNTSTGACLSVYDMDGTQLSEKQKLPVDELYCIGVSGNYLIGSMNQWEPEKILEAFDMSSGLREVELPFTEFSERGVTYYSYGTDYIYAGEEKRDFMIKNGDLSKYSSNYCIDVNDKYFVYDLNYMPAGVMYIDLSSQSFNDLSMPTDNSMVTLSDLEDNTLTLAFRETKQGRIDLRELIDSDMLRDHRCDLYAVFDLTTGKVQKKHTFKKYERIIYAGSEKIMTCKDGKITTYSADDFSKLNEQTLDLIEEDKTYYFYSGTENIYILDGKRENMIGKIPLN